MPLYPQLPIPRGRALGNAVTYYTVPGTAIGAVSTKALTASRIQYTPFVVDTTITLDQWICETTAAGAGGTVIRAAIYAADINRQPLARLVDGGTVVADTIAVKTATISITLPPGLYLSAIISDGTPTMRTMRGSLTSDLGVTIGTVPTLSGYRVAGSGATLPDPGTVWTAVDQSASGIEHMIAFRILTP